MEAFLLLLSEGLSAASKGFTLASEETTMKKPKASQPGWEFSQDKDFESLQLVVQ